MKEINVIYSNSIGIAFRWTHVENNLTQIIFRNTGFHLSEKEIALFVKKISEAKSQKKCKQCCLSANCKSILLQTPSNKVSMAISYNELKQIEDLLRGTLFKTEMHNYLTDLCKN